MLSRGFLQNLEGLLDIEIASISSVAGGDINVTWKLKTNHTSLFLKTNSIPQASAMFEAETAGLLLLAHSETIRIPQVLTNGTFEDMYFLILEFIQDTHTTPDFWENFGRQLAELHSQTKEDFGLDTDNFIGSLPQSNRRHSSWSEFYGLERLLPQAEMASSRKLLTSKDRKDLDSLITRLPEILPAEQPALLHGDLWSGNFLCTNQNIPVLIDPAAYYGHREMDLAMTRLFGGFHREFYRSYEECAPLSPGFESRLSIYQLYYLLVHLNIFGSGYYSSVQKIIQEFSSN